MPFDPTRHYRRFSRLKGYDYTKSGAYFVTMFTRNRGCLFGNILDGEMQLKRRIGLCNNVGLEIPAYFSHIAWDAFVIMPNPVHRILVIAENKMGRRKTQGRKTRTKNFSPLLFSPLLNNLELPR